MNKDGPLFEDILTSIVKRAVVEVLQEKAEQVPRYPEMVPVSVAAEITGYSRNSLYQMHSQNRIPGAHKVGRKLLFETAELQKWVKDGGIGWFISN